MNFLDKAEDLIEKSSEKSSVKAFMWISAIAAVFLLTMIISRLTPMLADDYYYAMNRVYGESTQVQGFGDIIRSAANCYKLNSGRALTLIMYHIGFMLPDWAFSAAAAAAFTAVTVLAYLLIRGGKRHSVTVYILTVASVWFFTPELGQDIFWKSGAVNYLFPLIPILGIMYIYRRHACNPIKNDGALMCIFLFVLGVISGWQLENSSVAVPCVAFLYMLYYKKKGMKLPKWSVSGFIGSVIGYLALISAKGNFVRLEAETAAVSLSLPFKFAMITYYWIMFAGVLTAVMILALIKLRAEKSGDCFQPVIFAAAALASAYCMLAAPTSPERTWFITVILMTVSAGAAVVEAYKADVKPLILKAFAAAFAAVILLASGADTILATYDISQQFEKREQLILSEKEKGNPVPLVAVYSYKYPLKSHKDALYGLYDVERGEGGVNGFNKAAAEYYGVDMIMGKD